MGNQIFLTVRRHEWHLNESLPTQAPTKSGINFTPISIIIYIYLSLCVCDVYSKHVSSRITIVRQKYRYFFLIFFFFFFIV